MRWSIINTIFRREVRDQLRDRRTLFMIFVLPILLYPIMGLAASQFSVAFSEKPRKVWVIGVENLPESPKLLNEAEDGFASLLFDIPRDARRLVVATKPAKGMWVGNGAREQFVRAREVDVVIIVPSDLREKLEKHQTSEINVLYISSDESSQVTYSRIREVLSRWQKSLIGARLKQDHLPSNYIEVLKLKPDDVATAEEVGGSMWGRLFPFLLVMMSLTGAFYPAIDICAGEKERGTMETLLICPASRAEIVMGKFFTVLLASVMTALLNLISMGLTGWGLAAKLGKMSAATAGGAAKYEGMMSPPSPTAAFWIVLILIPLAVFFSAICLSLAVLARSMKEGQYYMTPLYIICLPLIFITLMPGIKLDGFYALVPITGVSLLLRSLILGEYTLASQYFIPVLVPTIVYGAIALRWAVDQFQREDVLFGEAERTDLRVWVRHLLRDKEPTPNGGEALFCFAVMLCLAWFMTQYVALEGLTSLPGMIGLPIVYGLLPALTMAVFLTSSPLKSLKLSWPSTHYLLVAIGLALGLNPLVNELRPVVERMFPMPIELKQALEGMFKNVPNFPMAFVLFALVPGVCEELAFRGYILTGLQRRHQARTAILMSAILFGFMHVFVSLFQQLFNATLLGLVLGLLAVRSKSVLPGIVFHVINNGLAVAAGYWITTSIGGRTAPWLYRNPEQGLYHVIFVVIGVLVSAFLLRRLVMNHEPKPTAEVEI